MWAGGGQQAQDRTRDSRRERGGSSLRGQEVLVEPSSCPRALTLPECPTSLWPSQPHTSAPLTAGFPCCGAPPWGCWQHPALILTHPDSCQL